MLDFAKNLIMYKFRYNIDAQLKESKLLDQINKQIKLTNFF